jgi:HEAT repeat protein
MSEIPSFAVSNLTETSDGEIIGLAPIPLIEQLPEWFEDNVLSDALERLSSTDVDERAAAAHSLAQFQVQHAVDALAAMAARDESPMVRATAVASLGTINHESVFTHVLIAMGDEVRAAAARSLSRLDFDRADAYVRVMEMANVAKLHEVSKACVKAGLAAQAVDRLTSEDRRQAYEAFALLSLVAKAGECAPLLEAIEHHGDIDVRFAAIRLLAMMGQPADIVGPLRSLATRGNIPKKLSIAILDAVYRVEQSQFDVV